MSVVARRAERTGATETIGRLIRRNARAIRDALIIAGLLRAWFYFFVQGIQPWTYAGVDARAYWRIDLAHPYTESALGEVSTYLYSPAFAQLTAPFSVLPFEIFFAGWVIVSVILLVWLIRPWPWIGLMLLLPIVYELCVGNVHFLLAAMTVAAFRVPGAWAFGVLTKISPGVGLAWHLVRREWRALGTALALIAAVTAVSFAVSPSAWLDWIAFLRGNTGGSELLLPRLALGGLLVVVAAQLDRRVLVPVAIWISLPVVWINSWVILLACVPLAADDRRRHAEEAAA